MSSDAITEYTALVADVYELAGALRRQGDRLAGQVGQTQARWQLLSVLSEGSWTVPRAAERLGVSRQAVQRVADDLESEGLVRFVDNPQHRRSPIVELTAAGRHTLDAITAAAREWHRQVVDDVPEASLRRTRAALEELTSRIEAVNHSTDHSP